MPVETIRCVGIEIDPDKDYDPVLGDAISRVLSKYAEHELKEYGQETQPEPYPNNATVERHHLTAGPTMICGYRGIDGRRILFGQEVETVAEGSELIPEIAQWLRILNIPGIVGVYEWVPSANTPPKQQSPRVTVV